MFYFDRKAKIVLGFSFIVLLCSIIYLIGYYQGATKDIVKPAESQQEDTIPAPPDNRLCISAETFIPNFNSFYIEKIRILTFQNNQANAVKFINNARSVDIIGKGDPQNLDSIEIIFPKYDKKAYDEGTSAIAATILAVSPSSVTGGRYYIIMDLMGQLGLNDENDVNNASGIKKFDYNGKRYTVVYDGNRVIFSARTIPQ